MDDQEEGSPTTHFPSFFSPPVLPRRDIEPPPVVKIPAKPRPPHSPRRKRYGVKEEEPEIPPSETNPPKVEPPPEEPPQPEPPAVLDPDHPLLEKFQKALKEHLLKQIEHLNTEILELETEAKVKEAEREELGVAAYESQQVACKQQVELDNCLVKLKDTVAAREALEHEYEEAMEVYKQRTNELFQAEKDEMDLRNEVEALNLLLKQLHDYETEIESELLVNQRISEKAKQEKKLLLEEKRQQDILIYKWMTQVWALETEIDNMNMQLRVKEAEREKLAETAAQCNIEVEAFEAEYRCLMHSWHTVITAISNRDKVYNNVRKDLDDLQSKAKSFEFEIENVKRTTAKLIEENEAIVLEKNRIEFEIQRSTNQIEEENKKNEHLEKQIYEIQAIIDQVEKDIGVVALDNNRKSQALENVKRELERVLYEKVKLEEELVTKLKEQMLNSKEAVHILKLLKKCKERTKELEITLANKENLKSKLIMDSETQKFINGDLQRLIDDILVDQKEIETRINHYLHEKKNCEVRIHRKQREIDLVIKKIERQEMKIGVDYVSPQQQKLNLLEKTNEDIYQKNRELQKHWLREQGNIVNLSEQRQEQLRELNFLRKQVTILQQRNLKIEDEMELLKKQGDDLTKMINKAQHRLGQMDDTLTKKRDSKAHLDKQIDVLQIESIGKLKDAELDCLRLDTQILEIEEDKSNLSNKLVELNREMLAWEKKLKMAQETRQDMLKDNTEGGELATMRSEIHRMRVRYSQLKKAQDKLMNDLEYCIHRRESIFTTFEAREKKSPQIQEKTQISFNRKLDDMRNKLKKLDNEVVEATEKMEQIEQQKRFVDNDVNQLREEITSLEHQNECMSGEIDSMKTQNLMKLLYLSMRQKKLNTYHELSKGYTPKRKFRSESAMDLELGKLKDTNDRLKALLNDLIEKFPDNRKDFEKIQNLLQVHVLDFYS